jgi:hypothetical protein
MGIHTLAASNQPDCGLHYRPALAGHAGRYGMALHAIDWTRSLASRDNVRAPVSSLIFNDTFSGNKITFLDPS